MIRKYTKRYYTDVCDDKNCVVAIYPHDGLCCNGCIREIGFVLDDRDRWKERCEAAEELFRLCYICKHDREHDECYLQCQEYRKWLELIHKMKTEDRG